jgi:putative two-component system response regulator
MMRRILIVDDEVSLRSSLSRYLAGRGYEVVQAGSGAEAIRALQREKVACVLLDIGLPDQSGIDLVPRLLTLEPTLAILMLTGVADVSTAALCMQRGAFDYLAKPIELTDLDGAIGRAMERRDQLLGEHRSSDLLKDEVARLVVEVHRQQTRFEKLSVATLESLVYLLEAKSSYLAGHSVRVAQVAASLAVQLGRSDEDIEVVRLAARLHDLGMICIDDHVLSKQGRLTDVEFEQIKRHTIVGAQILGPMPNLAVVSGFVRGHHEHWDGKGYPDGLAGQRIPWGARVIGVAEVFDALTTSRPYQERMDPDQAIEHMGALVGTILGPEEYAAMAAVASRRQALVFIEDETEKAYPAGIPNDTLDGAALPGGPEPAAPANPAHER